MPDLLVKLDTGGTINGTIMYDWLEKQEDVEVFSAYDCIQVMCNKSKAYARQFWKRIRKSFEYDKFVWYVPLRIKSRPSPYKQPVVTREGPALTRTGMEFLRCYLKIHNKFKLDDSAFNRFMEGQRCMITEFDLTSSVPRK